MSVETREHGLALTTRTSELSFHNLWVLFLCGSTCTDTFLLLSHVTTEWINSSNVEVGIGPKKFEELIWIVFSTRYIDS